nr:unnamed protein product [Callosobruchus analis]
MESIEASSIAVSI